MKTLFYKLWAARCMPIKLAGLVFLAIYFYSHPVLFSPFWALAYFGLSMIGVLLYVWGTKLAAKFKNEPHYINEEAQYMYEHVSIIKKDNPLCFWLAPAETAFFYVPLLYVGVNPISAAVAAALFGFMHYPQQMLRNCIFKIFLQYVLIFTVLPLGILTMMAGHLLVDYLPLALLKWSHSDHQKTQEIEEPKNGLKGDAQKQRAP